jgi:glycosyltransferase involved in cell wall biosynthesis
MSRRPTLTIVIPVFNEELMIPELDRRLRSFLGQIGESWEVVFVDDGSHDASFAMLRELASQDTRYKVLAFSRNFGHQVAITAGLDRAEGDAVVIMDADLQDPPEVVRDMIDRWREGYDVVYGVRRRREGETLFKRASAAIYYRLLRSMLQFEIPVDAGDFRLLGRPVVMTLRLLRERHRFVRGMVSWVGFRQTAVYYDRPARFAGETKYPLRKMLRFALDGIASFSIVPLRIATWLGVLAGLGAIAVAVWAVYQKLFGVGVVQGWTTIMIVVAMGCSAQLLMTGILGEYVGRIYEEVKRRPLYALRDQVNVAASAPDVPVLPPIPCIVAEESPAPVDRRSP